MHTEMFDLQLFNTLNTYIILHSEGQREETAENLIRETNH